MSQQTSKHFIFYWDIFISVLATYAAIEIPLSMVIHYAPPVIISVCNHVITVCFIVDIFVRFRYLNSNHHSHRKATAEKKKYPRGWLTIDILAAIPAELINIIASSAGLGFLKWLRLLKVLRIVSFRSVWLNHINFNPVIVRLSFFFYFLLLCTHWSSCGWLALRLPEGAAIEHIVNQYVRALYWSMTTITTIGYGDITPNLNNNSEMLFTMLVEALGVSAYGYIIGNIANMLTNIDMAKARHKERVDRMNSFMKSKKIPQKLQEQVYQYYNYLWETRRGYNDATILSELPESFKFEFAMLLNSSIIEKVPLFKGADKNLVREVIFRLRPSIFIPGDAICVSGEIGDKMYFINKGSVEVVSQDGKQVYATLKEGDYFGEIALLLKQPRNATIRAIDYCDLYSLDKESFDDAISNYPEFEEHIKKLAKERMHALSGQ